MKNIFLTILFALSLISCEKSNEEKAKVAIKTYLNENLDDMTTYEVVRFGTLDSIHNTKNTLQPNWNFQMFHSYRIMGKRGYKTLKKRYFIFNSKLEIVTDNYYNFKIIEADSVVPDTAAAAPLR
jgi:hypothetical protein